MDDLLIKNLVKNFDVEIIFYFILINFKIEFKKNIYPSFHFWSNLFLWVMWFLYNIANITLKMLLWLSQL